MASPTSCQKRRRTDCPTPSSLQFRHSPQTDQIITGNASKCEGPTLKQQDMMYHIPCSDCPNAYVDPTGRQLSTRVKEHKGAVRRQDENSLLALHYLMTSHAFDWNKASVIGKGTTRDNRRILSRHGTQPPHASVSA